MTRSRTGAVFTALVIAAFAVLTPLRAVADSPHPPGANRVELEVDAATFTIPDPGGYGYDVWVALYTKAGDNAHKLWDGSLEPGTVVTSREFNHKGNERDISHVDLYGGRHATTTTTTTTTTPTTVPPTQPTVPPTEPTVPPTEPTVPPTEPTVPPTEPSVPPTQPTVPPTQPTVPPTDPPTVPPTTVPTDVLPWEETTSVPPTLAPPLGRIPNTGPAAIAPIGVIAGSMLLAGAVAIAATRRRPTR